MKKVLSFVLALVMVMALSVTAFAEGTTYTEVKKDDSKDITANYDAGKDTVPTVYSFTTPGLRTRTTASLTRARRQLTPGMQQASSTIRKPLSPLAGLARLCTR